MRTDDTLATVTKLARDLVAIDSRSFVPNLAVAERIEAALPDFDVERLDYTDAAGIGKRVLVAARGGPGGLALSGHMDTVPDTGWQDDPWSARIEGDTLHGLGSTDMKGPVAAIIVAARALPPTVPVTLLITTDEETTKAGARAIVDRSALVRRMRPKGILVAEPTGMVPVRGHRSQIAFTCEARGLQAHSSTGHGDNANWKLVPFLVEMHALFARLRTDTRFHDDAYDPPFSDFNPVIDNHGTATNVTVPLATVRIKFRYSASIDPAPILAAVRDAGERHGVSVGSAREGSPPELPPGDPLIRLASEVTGAAAATAPYGTDASVLQELAPCVVLGPGDIGVAHTPTERASLAALADAVPVFMRLAEKLA
jgi:acetylornithine deacetylase/succinyl-diaminopimelate desuccinylase-like protein